jgi:hypothetical protein
MGCKQALGKQPTFVQAIIVDAVDVYVILLFARPTLFYTQFRRKGPIFNRDVIHMQHCMYIRSPLYEYVHSKQQGNDLVIILISSSISNHC